MRISAMVAAAKDNAIGQNNDLLWHLPDDMKFFKRTTSGHAVIMGRKTLESFKRPLPNRENIVITRNEQYSAEGVHVVHGIKEALEKATAFEEDEVFVLGGGEIYAQALDLCNRVYITRVQATFPDAEAHFPEMNLADWELVSEEKHEADDRHAHAFSFLTYDRKA